MNILFITHRFPHPPNRGDSIRSFHFLERFSEMGTVSLATLYDQEPCDESWQVLNSICTEVLASRWGSRRKWFKAGFSLLCGRTMTRGLFYKYRFGQQLHQLVSGVHFDRIVVFCSSMAQYLHVLRGTINEKTPVIMDLVDVDSQKWFDYASRCGGVKKWLFQLEGKRLRRLEMEIGTRCAAILAVTPEETALYESFAGELVHRENPGLQIAAIPNGVDTEYFDANRSELSEFQEEPFRLVFVGALDYRANVDGVVWFAENVLPQLRERFPACVLDVVGSRPVPLLKHLSETVPGLNLTGTVPDVRPSLKRASVAVIPLQVARGLQNKVLEACAMSRPVVASTCAAEGIHRQTEQDFCVCQTPTQWLETLTKLFSEQETRERLARNGRAMVEKCYGWKPQLEKLERLLAQAGSEHRS